MSAKRKTSYLWKYFSQSVPTEAKCNLCSRVLSVTNSCIGNLARHLRLKHRDLVVSREPTRVESKLEAEEGATQSESVRSYSYVWRYFDRLGGERARCVVCHATLSAHTITNLARHLTRKHCDLDISKEPTATKDGEETEKAEVWRYFEVTYEDNCEARCAVCLEEVSYRDGAEEMRKHLVDAHPDLAAESEKPKLALAAASGGPSLSCDEMSFDQVYLEDNLRASTPDRSRLRRRKKKKRPKTPASTDSEDDRPVKPKKGDAKHNETNHQNDDDQSIDNFGRYITSLIKKLPKHIACKIQMDFVTQIMQAQLEYESSQANDTVPVVEIVREELDVNLGLVNGERNSDELKDS